MGWNKITDKIESFGELLGLLFEIYLDYRSKKI